MQYRAQCLQLICIQFSTNDKISVAKYILVYHYHSMYMYMLYNAQFSVQNAEGRPYNNCRNIQMWFD